MLRLLRRAVALVLILSFCVIRFWLIRLRGPMTLEMRALWLQETSRRVLKCLHVTTQVDGVPAVCGLVVANHLSYLDVLIISAAMPCFFVARHDVAQWPYFGMAARMGGTIFLDRSSRASAMHVAGQIEQRLKLPVPVLLFPEGTSTDGSHVLPFHSRLISPATMAGVPITAAAVRYELSDDLEERELCWYGDATFLPHLVKVLGITAFTAHLQFGESQVYADRRAAARLTHAEITDMREARVAVAQ
jgi:lyso-ornithine lipid O-acyltransferase